MTFRFLGDEVVHEGRIVTFCNGRFIGPDGEEFQRDIVRHPGAVSAVAVDRDLVYLVRQYRAPLDAELWEIPAGKKDIDGEPADDTIRRELAEEIGMRAGRLEHLISIHHSPGFCDEEQTIFLATELQPVERTVDGIEEQHMVVRPTPVAEAVGMALDGSITDAKSVVGLLAAARRLGW